MQPRKIRVADIERLRRTLDNVPESRVEEVTTVEAVRMLTSEIHAMQAKGEERHQDQDAPRSRFRSRGYVAGDGIEGRP